MLFNKSNSIQKIKDNAKILIEQSENNKLLKLL